jgi:hypothetical protein
VFGGFALVFEIVEHFILGAVRGKTLAEVWLEIQDKGWPHLAAMILVVFVAFLPFFAFREMEQVLGEGKIQDLFFKRRIPVANPGKTDRGQPIIAIPDPLKSKR